MKKWPIVIFGVVLASAPSLAQELDVNDLRRPGPPLVERYTIPGLGSEGRSIIQRFGEVDDQRVANSRSSYGGGGGNSGGGQRVYACKLVCRTTGFALYQTRDMGVVSVRAYDHNVREELNRICKKIPGDSWYESSHKCD